MVHIPYPGSARAMTDLVAGSVQLTFDSFAVTAAQIEGKRIKAIAVASDKRLEALPSTPTMIEAGMPNLVVSPWLGVLFPRGTPQEPLQAMNSEIRKVLALSEVKTALAAIGGTPRPSGADEFANLLQKDFEKWKRVVKDSGAAVD